MVSAFLPYDGVEEADGASGVRVCSLVWEDQECSRFEGLCTAGTRAEVYLDGTAEAGASPAYCLATAEKM